MTLAPFDHVALAAERRNLQRRDLPALLGEVLDAFMALAEADFGNIQLLDPDGRLRIVTHRGFPDWWLEYANSIAGGYGASGVSLALGERVVVEDVEQSPIFAGTPALDIQLKAGIRSVQATPLSGQSGQVLGTLCTHYRTPHRPDAKTLQVLDLLAEHAATLIEGERTERALKEARDRLAEAQKIAHLGSFECAVASGATVWSEEQYRIYGLDPAGPSPTFEEVLARCVFPEDRDRFHKGISVAIENQRAYDQEHRLVRPDGSVRWVHTRAHPYFDEQGKLLRYVGTSLDITEHKRREEAQKHSELMQAMARQQVAVQTAAAFAHELNQPLVSIAAYSEVALRLLRSNKEKTDQLTHAIEGGHEQALRAGQVLHELMDHLHKGEMEPVPFDINGLITEMIDKMRETYGGLEPTLDLEPGLPPVLGNRLQTEKVLLNLIQNGVEAMQEAGLVASSIAIAVRTLAGHKMAHVTVRDSGPGLDAETARRVFDPFFTTKPGGLGLGLAISRSLIEAQGGQLWLDPEDGPGAVFHFTLPFAHE